MSRNGSEERDCAQIQLGTYHLITLRYSRAKEIGAKKLLGDKSVPTVFDPCGYGLPRNHRGDQTSDEGGRFSQGPNPWGSSENHNPWGSIQAMVAVFGVLVICHIAIENGHL